MQRYGHSSVNACAKAIQMPSACERDGEFYTFSYFYLFLLYK